VNKRNPFKHNGELLPVASINSVYVDDTKAIDLFRPTLIMNEILQKKDLLGLTALQENESLLETFNHLLQHDLDSIKRESRHIAKKYGDRLAKVLSTLFSPSLKSISNRNNWDQEHWDYWKTIEHLYLVGGLTSPILTTIFYDCIEKEFKIKGIEQKKVTFIEGSQNLGTQGLSTIVEDGDYLLFDFGQTSIKRRRHMKRHGIVVVDTVLPPVPADYLFYKSSTDDELLVTAKRLDDYIIDIIEQTMKEVDYQDCNYIISIANYVSNGTIYPNRGGYGKLHLVANNYQSHLSNRLSDKCNNKANVTLYHDTSAMGLLFREQPHTAVISLGTAFGVAFVD
jgi:hypothetical protein